MKKILIILFVNIFATSFAIDENCCWQFYSEILSISTNLFF
jgi:hypothetical protein